MNRATHRELACLFVTVTSLALWAISERRRKRLLKCQKRDLPSWIEAEHYKPPKVTRDSATDLQKATVHEMRRNMFCAAQSVSYANSGPLMVLRGKGSKLYDEEGNEYLDTRNNVGHIGHSHPKVVAAVAAQAAQINTNTRYLHPNLVCLASELLAKCPKPLSRVFFVNSGSEANDLALRLARAYTKKKDTILVEHAYHGHTCEVICVSPYKFQHKGGRGKRPWVHVVPAPDLYRGPHGDPATAGQAYARYVADAVRDCKRAEEKEAAAAAAADTERRRDTSGGGDGSGVGGDRGHGVAVLSSSSSEDGEEREETRGLAAFIVESGMSVAGVILPPRGYLSACFEAVRAGGGLCIADEVQTGFGRFGGETFWGFQHQHHDDEALESGGSLGSVVPDIVTCGKPFGNGMPLAAVVTTEEVANAFEATGIEYFNTFGGNPVCCAAGLEVLKVLEEEGLLLQAGRVGRMLRAGLRQLATVHQSIGDVRGAGLFIGVDLVRSRDTKQPATNLASRVATQLKGQHRILTSLDGPGDNVLVLKPPLAFNSSDAETFLSAFGSVLAAIEAEGGVGEDESSASHTPT